MRLNKIILFLVIIFFSCDESTKYDVIIVGGGVGGTSAAVEFAVRTLEVSNIIVIGHSQCGGVNAGYFLCKSHKPLNDFVFVNNWLDILKPAYNNISNNRCDQCN